MVDETLHHRGTTLVRRLILAPGEATRWHRDPFQRISVVFKGEALSIEFRDSSASVRVALTPGQVDWDEAGDRIHRAVNVGCVPYEEVTIFFLAHPDDVPQPDVPLINVDLRPSGIPAPERRRGQLPFKLHRSMCALVPERIVGNPEVTPCPLTGSSAK